MSTQYNILLLSLLLYYLFTILYTIIYYNYNNFNSPCLIFYLTYLFFHISPYPLFGYRNSIPKRNKSRHEFSKGELFSNSETTLKRTIINSIPIDPREDSAPRNSILGNIPRFNIFNAGTRWISILSPVPPFVPSDPIRFPRAKGYAREQPSSLLHPLFNFIDSPSTKDSSKQRDSPFVFLDADQPIRYKPRRIDFFLSFFPSLFPLISIQSRRCSISLALFFFFSLHSANGIPLSSLSFRRKSFPFVAGHESERRRYVWRIGDDADARTFESLIVVSFVKNCFLFFFSFFFGWYWRIMDYYLGGWDFNNVLENKNYYYFTFIFK